MKLVFEKIRARSHGNLARIGVDKNIRKKLFNEEKLDEIAKKLNEFGFKYVTFDIRGYRMGSLNEIL